MSDGARRGVTRGYVQGLIAATLTVTSALVLVSWGGLGLLLDRGPVTTDGVPLWFGVVTIVVALALLAFLLWRNAIGLLKGRKAPDWGSVIVAAGLAYLVWCLCGILAGLSIDETWVSPFAGVLAPIWAIAALLFWAVLARRVYTDRPTPKWPWERREEED